MWHNIGFFVFNLGAAWAAYFAIVRWQSGESWTEPVLWLIFSSLVISAVAIPARWMLRKIRPWQLPDPLPDEMRLSPSILPYLQITAYSGGGCLLGYGVMQGDGKILGAIMFFCALPALLFGLAMLSVLAGSLVLRKSDLEYRLFHRRYSHHFEEMTETVAKPFVRNQKKIYFASNDARSVRHQDPKSITYGVFDIGMQFGDLKPEQLAELINTFRERALTE